jgi:transcriptional regulator
MYVPASFRVSDEKTLHAFIETYDFGTVITATSAGIVASHIPIVLRHGGDKLVLVGHVARANDQWRHLDGGAEALVIFQGPHAYISPSWYATAPAVPTWNYAAVHVYGKPRANEDPVFTASALEALVARYESTRTRPWRTEDLPGEFYAKLATGIVAFEMPIERIEGKFKLGQNRPEEDRVGMLAGLEAEGSPNADALAAFIRTHAGSCGIFGE